MVTSPNWIAPRHIARATISPSVRTARVARDRRTGNPRNGASGCRTPCGSARQAQLGLRLGEPGDHPVAEPVEPGADIARARSDRGQGRLEALDLVELLAHTGEGDLDGRRV